MKNTETEKLNLAMVRAGKGYEEWSSRNNLADYMVIILYELLLKKELTQKQLVKLSDAPKQSINKGIHRLVDLNYLNLTIDQNDKRIKYCRLTPKGEEFAREKLASLFKLEEEVANKLGTEKMKQLADLCEEWSSTFWEFLGSRKEKR